MRCGHAAAEVRTELRARARDEEAGVGAGGVEQVQAGDALEVWWTGELVWVTGVVERVDGEGVVAVRWAWGGAEDVRLAQEKWRWARGAPDVRAGARADALHPMAIVALAVSGGTLAAQSVFRRLDARVAALERARPGGVARVAADVGERVDRVVDTVDACEKQEWVQMRQVMGLFEGVEKAAAAAGLEL